MFKDRIVIWTPDLPEGYGVCDQDYEDELIDELIEDEEIDITQNT